jgi:siderophore synthetase component
LESVAEYYQLNTFELWQILAQALQEALNAVPFSDEARSALQHILFEEEHWPYKQLIRPLLEQDNRTGSMPSRMGQTCNFVKKLQTAEKND